MEWLFELDCAGYESGRGHDGQRIDTADIEEAPRQARGCRSADNTRRCLLRIAELAKPIFVRIRRQGWRQATGMAPN